MIRKTFITSRDNKIDLQVNINRDRIRLTVSKNHEVMVDCSGIIKMEDGEIIPYTELLPDSLDKLQENISSIKFKSRLMGKEMNELIKMLEQ